MQDD